MRSKRYVLSMFVLVLCLMPNVVASGDFDEDEQKIGVLAQRGIDVEIPHRVKFLLVFPREGDAILALKEAKKGGFEKEEMDKSSAGETFIWVSANTVLELRKIKQIHKRLKSIASRFNGQYEWVEWELVPK